MFFSYFWKWTRQISLNGFLFHPALICNLKRFIAQVLSPFIHAFTRKDETFSLRFFKFSNLIILFKIRRTKGRECRRLRSVIYTPCVDKLCLSEDHNHSCRPWLPLEGRWRGENSWGFPCNLDDNIARQWPTIEGSVSATVTSKTQWVLWKQRNFQRLALSFVSGQALNARDIAILNRTWIVIKA